MVYDKQSDRDLFDRTPFFMQPTVEFYDMNTSDGRKKGYKLKSTWAAKENPFIVLEKDDKPIKIFYSDSYKDGSALKQLIEYDTNISNS